MNGTLHFTNIFHHINGVSEKEYQNATQTATVLNAFASLSNMWIYIINLHKDNFLYLSDHPNFLSGHTVEEVKEMGYQYYEQHVPEKDRPLLKEVHQAIIEKMSKLDVEEKQNYIASYNFHLIINNKEKQVLLQSTPIAWDAQGKCWLVACAVSLSPHSSCETLIMRHQSSNHFWEYSFTKHAWKERKIELSEQEKEILLLSAKGESIKESAKIMYTSPQTIKYHRMKILKILGASNMTEALAMAYHYNLL
jgi:DNA-binding CsgD family transcriptional regulator